MTRIVKIMLCTALMFGALSVSAFAQEEKKEINILCVGNSILMHGPNDSIGWSGNYGMAATSADKDYYALIQKYAKENFPEQKIKWTRVPASPFERSIDKSQSRDYTAQIEDGFGYLVKQKKPDIVIFQFGENTSSDNITSQSFAYALKFAADYCRKFNPECKFIFTTTFWESDVKGKGARLGASMANAVVANLSPIGQVPENKATGIFENAFVADHPSDAGMECIAKEIYGQLSEILYKMQNPKEVSVNVDNSYVKSEVRPTIIDGNTMVPLRAIFEALGTDVQWIDQTKTVVSTKDSVNISLTIGSKTMLVNHKEVQLEVAPVIVEGNTLLPLRAISSAFGCQVGWVDSTKTAYVYSDENLALNCAALNNNK